MADPVLDIIVAGSGQVPVTAGGTITFQYPDGRARATYMGDGSGPAIMGVRANQAIYAQDLDFTIVFNSTNIVVTFLSQGAVAIPANVPVSLQLPIRDTSGFPVAQINPFAVPAEMQPSGL